MFTFILNRFLFFLFIAFNVFWLVIDKAVKSLTSLQRFILNLQIVILCGSSRFFQIYRFIRFRMTEI